MQREDELVAAEFDAIPAELEPPQWFRERSMEENQARLYCERFHHNPQRNHISLFILSEAPQYRRLRQLEQDITDLALIIRSQYMLFRSIRNRYNETVRLFIVESRLDVPTNQEEPAVFDEMPALPEMPTWFIERDQETRNAFMFSRRFQQNPYRTYIYSSAERIINLTQTEHDIDQMTSIIHRRYLQYRLMRRRLNVMGRRIIARRNRCQNRRQ